MLFWLFQNACRKYEFSFALSNCGMYLTLILRPHNTFENLEIKDDRHNYKSVLKQGINMMKSYRIKNK